MPKLFLFLLQIFFKNPLGFRVQIFHKNAPGMEGHVPSLKFENLGQRTLNSFKLWNRTKNGIDSKNFQIHLSNTLFEEVMSSSLHDLNWMNLNSKAKGESHFIPSHSKFKKNVFNFFFKFSLNSITQSNNHSFNSFI